jgi:hypothetical protein
VRSVECCGVMKSIGWIISIADRLWAVGTIQKIVASRVHKIDTHAYGGCVATGNFWDVVWLPMNWTHGSGVGDEEEEALVGAWDDPSARNHLYSTVAGTPPPLPPNAEMANNIGRGIFVPDRNEDTDLTHLSKVR